MAPHAVTGWQKAKRSSHCGAKFSLSGAKEFGFFICQCLGMMEALRLIRADKAATKKLRIPERRDHIEFKAFLRRPD